MTKNKTDDKLITGDDIETYGDLILNNGSNRVIILTGAASASNKTITFPNLTGNVILDTSTFNRYSLHFNAAVLSTVNVSTNYYFGSQFTLAPSTTGVPTFKVSPLETAKTSVNSTVESTSAFNFSTNITSPSWTLNCFPPVTTTAYIKTPPHNGLATFGTKI